MRFKLQAVFIAILMGVLFSAMAFAHCQVPCGIYDDELRTKLIAEHAGTIEKAMKQIISLGKQTPVNHNQLVRWITTKEDHANQIQEIVTQYFMTQRIKPDQENYSQKIQVLHQMLIAAMKCKQTTEVEHVGTLLLLLKEFEKLYFGHN
jgi:nickel superoxide dismutase